mgnify:FL=1
MNNVTLGIILLAGGTWLTQDAFASVLYYLKRDNEKWYFNHLVRLFRGAWGLIFIGLGIYLLGGIR